MPRISYRSNRPTSSDMMQASITQLNRLPAAILRLHLTTHHLVSTGTKATMARRLYESIHQAPPQQTTASSMPETMLLTSTPVSTMPTTTPETTTPTMTQTSTMPNVYLTGLLPEASQQCIASFPQLASLLNQFICHATSGQAAPSGQTVPAALSPASIDVNIDSQVMAAHQQLQPSTAACQSSAIVTASAAPPPIYSQLLPQQTLPVQPQQLQHTLPIQPQKVQQPLLFQPPRMPHQFITQQDAAQQLSIPVPAQW